jgi:hypothetical protein
MEGTFVSETACSKPFFSEEFHALEQYRLAASLMHNHNYENYAKASTLANLPTASAMRALTSISVPSQTLLNLAKLHAPGGILRNVKGLLPISLLHRVYETH